MITNKITNKRYIGVTTKKKGFNGRYDASGKGIERVFNSLDATEKLGTPRNVHLYNSINKYGFKNFDVIEEFDFAISKEELQNKERYWISHYRSNDYKYGYNNTNGGEGLDGGHQNFISKLKRRLTNSRRINISLEYSYRQRLTWKNEYYCIWDYNDGLNKKQKELLWRKIDGIKTKFCKICNIEYYNSGKGKYCKECGDEQFLKEYELNNK